MNLVFRPFLFLSCILASFAIMAKNVNYEQNSFDALKNHDWNKAYDYAQKSQNPALKKLVTVKKYISGYGSFEEITTFILNNPNWPELADLYRAAERSIGVRENFAKIYSWFIKHPPRTGEGYKNYATAAYKTLGPKIKNDPSIKIKLDKIIRQAWSRGKFSATEQKAFYLLHHNILLPSDHIDKINYLLWDGNIKAALALIHLVSKPYQEMFKVRIAALEGDHNTDKLFNNLDLSYRYRSGILYSYMKYKIKRQDFSDQAVSLLLKAPIDNKYSAKWWEVKAYYIRELIAQKKYQLAYQIANKHYAAKAEDYAEKEWIAGWLALQFLGKTDIALVHFKRLHSKVSSPMSLSRGAYWVARCYYKKLDNHSRLLWLKKAALYPETFYGQLAANALGHKTLDLYQFSRPVLLPEEIDKFKQKYYIQALELMLKHNQKKLAQDFIASYSCNLRDSKEVVLILNLLRRYKQRYLAVMLSKRAYQKLHLRSYADNYPRPYDLRQCPLEPSFINALIRQESNFDHAAESSAKALGIMQVIAPTASLVAKALHIPYEQSRLLTDINYNVKIGSSYMRQMIKEFDGSFILAISAYNAGPHNAKKWIKQNGDPRHMKHVYEVIDWIELISFAETRNYVQRIMENIQVYRYFLQQDKTLRLVNDLKRGVK